MRAAVGATDNQATRDETKRGRTSDGPHGSQHAVRVRLRGRGRRWPQRTGRQGGRSLRDDAARASCAERLHGDDRCLPRTHGERWLSGRTSRGARRRRSPARSEDRQDVRVDPRPAARLGPLRRRDLDARDDGQRPRPRSVGFGRRGDGAHHRQRAFRLRLLPSADSDVRRGRRRHPRRAVRGRAFESQGRPRRGGRHRPDCRRSSRARRHLQGDLCERAWAGVPAGRPHAAARRSRGGLRLVAEPTSPGLPAPERHPRHDRHRRQHRPDGLWKRGSPVSNRCRLLTRPVDGRTKAVRRVPHRRAGRGCGGRHSCTAEARQARAASPGRLCGVSRGDGDARAALP